MLAALGRFLFGNLRRQLTSGIVVIVTCLMALFVWDTTRQAQATQNERHVQQLQALARSAATSSAVWVISRDFAGLQEIILGVARYPNLRHAIVLDTTGLVLAHNEPGRIGLYMRDTPVVPETRVVPRSESLIEVFSPIMLEDKHIGWIRIGLDRAPYNAELAEIWRRGVMYLAAGALLSALFAALAARYLTRRLDAIQRVANAVQAGESGLHVKLAGDDEAARLASHFNNMIDGLAQRQATLKESEERFRSLTEMSSDYYWESDSGHQLISCSNRAIADSMPGSPAWNALRTTMEAHSPFRNVEFTQRLESGNEHYFILSGNPVFDAQGGFIGYRGVGAEITARKLADAALRESEELFRIMATLARLRR